MGEMVKAYHRKIDRVDAVTLTAGNAEEVTRWCGGKIDEEVKPGDPTDVRIRVLVPNIDGNKWANLGDFIVLGSDGRFRVVKSKEFLAEYESPTRGVADGGGGVDMSDAMPRVSLPAFKPLQHNPMEGYRRG